MAFVPLSSQPVFDRGSLVEGALLWAYDAGTTNPRQVFLDKGQDPTRVYPTPIMAANATWPLMWVGVGDYDVKIARPDGSQIRFIAGLPGDAAPSDGQTTFDPLRQLATGTVVRFYGQGRRNGYVRANGATIGSGASDATERANDDCHDLFVFLYTQDPNLVVIGGRDPAGAEADWTAGKTITLPGYPDRVQVGTGGAYALGQVGGEATHVLTETELAAHGHAATLSISPAGGFTPSGTISSIGDHAHTVNYNFQQVYVATGNAGAVGSVAQPTSNQSGPTTASGGHNHIYTGNAVPDHTHTGGVGIVATGGNAGHNNLQPFIGDTAYLKL